MGKKSTYPTLAGQHAPTHEPGGEDVVAGVVPGAHVLATTGPHTNTLPLTDLEVGVQGEVIVRGAADWEALGVGVANEALLSGGAGVTPSWGAPTPAAHVLATTGPHSSSLPLADLAPGAQGEIITRTGADWVAFAVGGAGQALLSGGVGADVSWGAPAPAAHEGSHVSGGSDDIDSALDGRAIGFSEQGDIVYASGATTLAALAHGNAGQFLQSQGHGANPIWADSSAPQLSDGLNEQAAFLSRNYAALASETYATIVDVTAAGFITGLMIQIQCEDPDVSDFIIEIDGAEVAPFEVHPDSDGNIGAPAGADVHNANFAVDWDVDYNKVFILSPLYRFDTSFKIRLYNNDNAAPKSIGCFGNMTYLTE